MAIEHVVGVGIIGLLNYKVIRNMSIWEHEQAKTFLDIATILVVLFGIGLELIGSFTGYLHIGTILFFEAIGLVVTFIIDKVYLVKKTFKDLNKIKPLDL